MYIIKCVTFIIYERELGGRSQYRLYISGVSERGVHFYISSILFTIAILGNVLEWHYYMLNEYISIIYIYIYIYEN